MGPRTLNRWFDVGRNTHIRDDGECVIGSSESITLVVLLVDVAVNALLTGLFLVPLMRYTILCPQVRQVAVRNFTYAQSFPSSDRS
jgi:hypothetical protein